MAGDSELLSPLTAGTSRLNKANDPLSIHPDPVRALANHLRINALDSLICRVSGGPIHSGPFVS
jgi:hypothetical protein